MTTTTHVMMNGGTLKVSDKDKFFSAYLEKVITGNKQYMVEMKMDQFKFYIDFDLKTEGSPISDDDVLEIFKQWEEAVKGPVYIAKTQPRIVDGFWKSGFHLIWTNRVVKKQTYTRFRNSIILKTPEMAKFVDTPTSGLRMLWSHKYPVGKPYVPWIKIHQGKIEHLNPEPNLKMLEIFSIQCKQEESLQTPSTSKTEETSSRLEDFIRKNIRGQENCNVKKILRTKGGDICVQTDSSFCENLGGMHKSNHVWFLIQSNRIQQKCHCTCDVKRKFGVTCKKFSGRKYIVPSSILEEIEEVPFETDGSENILDFF